jgi:predicted AlkP superfamily phosphohydrolase/phosphomutase/tetratricopeptide (TPR) repeat protein
MANRRVLLIGWDAADWKVIDRLMDEGKMPNVAGLVERGVMGNLATLYPSLSPTLWTSIATGKRPYKHGIWGFTEPDPATGTIRPVTNLSRKTRAIWNILQTQGLKSNVIGWWPSHPAEPISGVMVSDMYHKAHAPIDKPWPMRPGTVHPPRLSQPLADLRLHPCELGAEHIGPFVPDFGKIDQDKDHRLETLAKTIAECTTIHSAATAAMQLEPWDFMGVYYDSIDHFSHAFMRFNPPRMDWVDEEDYELFKGVVEGGYRYHDMMLGALLALAGEDTTVIIVSDHGFHPDHLRPQHVPVEPAGPAVQHRNHGIFVMAGPGVKHDERIYGMSLLDVTPTILRLFDLPVGEDMDGVPLVSGFVDGDQDVPTIPSWDDVEGEDGSHPEGTAIDPVEASEAVNQLVALGYIEPPNENQEKAVADTVRELHYNVARSYMDAGRHLEAVPYLEKLFEGYPEETRFGLHLVECLQALDRIEQSRQALEATIKGRIADAEKAREELKEWQEEHKDQKPEDMEEKERHAIRKLHARASTNPAAFMMLQGVQLVAENKPQLALPVFRKLSELMPGNQHAHLRAGQAMNLLRKWQDAEKCFREVIADDPQSARAHLGLCRALLGLGRKKSAAESALAAVSLQHFNPVGHYLLGLAFLRQGRVPRAVEAFQTAVHQNPNYPEAHRLLAVAYEKYFHDPAKAKSWRQEGNEARERIAALRSGEMEGDQEGSAPTRRTMASDEEVLKLGTPIAPPDDVAIADTVVVVSGLPRSGTSMMMQMLMAGGFEACSDDKREADDSNQRGYFEDERVKALGKDNSWLDEAKGKAVKVVAPLLFRLPRGPQHNYRVVFMERDLGEVVRSQRAMLERLEREGTKMADQKLQKVYAEQLRRVKRLLAASHMPTLFVGHLDCIQRPAEVAERVRTFLSGELEVAAAAAVVDPSLHRERAEQA